MYIYHDNSGKEVEGVLTALCMCVLVNAEADVGFELEEGKLQRYLGNNRPRMGPGRSNLTYDDYKISLTNNFVYYLICNKNIS